MSAPCTAGPMSVSMVDELPCSYNILKCFVAVYQVDFASTNDFSVPEFLLTILC